MYAVTQAFQLRSENYMIASQFIGVIHLWKSRRQTYFFSNNNFRLTNAIIITRKPPVLQEAHQPEELIKTVKHNFLHLNNRLRNITA